jgi:mannose-6-phosphate isomerase
LRGLTLHELWCKHRAEIFGNVPDSPRFPILCKLLDAQENLSLQVHPPRAIAKKLGGESKSELWFIAHAAAKARLYAGVKKGTTPDGFAKAIEQGRIDKHLHAIEVNTGDAIFLPSGRMHALGAGVVLVEIQENSDTTYRIYDWDRTKKGRAARQMHIAEAMQCVDFKDVEPGLLRPEGEPLVRNELFEIEKWILSRDREIAESGRFAIVVCLSGEIDCAGRKFKPGDFFLVTAQQQDRIIRPIGRDVSLLRVTLPR